jgi:hypothetical protein
MIPGEGKEPQKRGERAKRASLARFFEFPAKMSDLLSEGQKSLLPIVLKVKPRFWRGFF